MTFLRLFEKFLQKWKCRLPPCKDVPVFSRIPDSTIDIDDISQTTPLERAQNLFNCIDHENEDTLTREEFIAGIIETGAKKNENLQGAYENFSQI